MWIKQMILVVLGLSAGVAAAGGLFSFIVGLGVVSEFADRTHTGDCVLLYEESIALGGIFGNLFYLFPVTIPYGQILVPIFGVFGGDFCRVLGNDLGRNFEYFPNFHQTSEASPGNSLYYCGDSIWKRNWFADLFLERLGIIDEKKKENKQIDSE